MYPISINLFIALLVLFTETPVSLAKPLTVVLCPSVFAYWNNFINLRPCDVIKFVIGSDEDMNLTIDIVKKLKQVYTEMPHIYLGAVYGMYDAQKLVNIMLKEPVLCDATFQIQLHKVIWDPEERGV